MRGGGAGMVESTPVVVLICQRLPRPEDVVADDSYSVAQIHAGAGERRCWEKFPRHHGHYMWFGYLSSICVDWRFDSVRSVEYQAVINDCHFGTGTHEGNYVGISSSFLL